MAQDYRPFRLTLSLHEELYAAVRVAAARQYTRPSEWVRRAIANELERAGLAGIDAEKRPGRRATAR